MVAEHSSVKFMASKGMIESALKGVGDDPRQREEVLTRFLAETADKMASLEAELEKARKIAEEAAAAKMAQGKEAGGLPLSKQRGLERVPEFSGVYAEYHAFHKKALTFFSDSPGLREVIKEVEKSSKVFDDKGYYVAELQKKYPSINIKNISGEVHTVLVLVTAGTAASMVDAAEGNGLLAWRKLFIEYNDLNPTGKRQLLDSIMHPRRAKTVDDIPAAQVEWEALVKRYTDCGGVLGDDMLITGYLAALPQETAD